MERSSEIEIEIPERFIRRWTETRDKASRDPMHIGKEVIYCSEVIDELKDWLDDHPAILGGRRRHWYDPTEFFVRCTTDADAVLFRMTFDIHD